MAMTSKKRGRKRRVSTRKGHRRSMPAPPQQHDFTLRLRKMILRALDVLGCTKKDLALHLGVSPGVLYRFLRTEQDNGLARRSVDAIAAYFVEEGRITIRDSINYRPKMALRRINGEAAPWYKAG